MTSRTEAPAARLACRDKRGEKSVTVHFAFFMAGAGVEFVLVEVLALLSVLAVIGVHRFGGNDDVIDGGVTRLRLIGRHAATIIGAPPLSCTPASAGGPAGRRPAISMLHPAAAGVLERVLRWLQGKRTWGLGGEVVMQRSGWWHGGVAAVAVCAALVGPIGLPVASATGLSTVTVDGTTHVAGLGPVDVGVTAAGSPGGPVTGLVTAQTIIGATPVRVLGPVTCLIVRGSTASVSFVVAGITPPVLPPAIANRTVMDLTVQQGGDGRPSRIGVRGPLAIPASVSAAQCDPGPAPSVLTGTVDVRDA